MSKETEKAAVAPSETWLDKGRATINFSSLQRGFLAQVEALLTASPDADQPVTPSAVLAHVCAIAQEDLLRDGLVDEPPSKTTRELLREGKAVVSAKVAAEAPAAGAKGEAPAGSGEGDEDAAKLLTPPSAAPLKFKGQCRGCQRDMGAGEPGWPRPGLGQLGTCCKDRLDDFLAGRLPAPA